MNRHLNKMFSVITILALMLAALPMQSAQAVSADIVISQVYGGGGNSGATLKNDFIELFNRGTTPVDMTGWSVQYASSAGFTWQKTDLSGILQPGQYYLVQEAAGAGGTVNLPTPDATGAIPMSATAGKVALVNNNTLITSGTVCPSGATIVDFLGFGTATNCSETSPTTPNLSNTTAALRGANGCTETDNNAADFANGAPAPRNTASPLNPCVAPDAAPEVTGTFPVNGATDFPVNANLTVTFSEPVDVTSSWFTLTCSVSGPSGVATAFSGGPTTFTLDPGVSLTDGETCTLTVLANQVSDQDTNDLPDNMVENFVVGFTAFDVCGEPFTPIHSIQGSGLSAAITGTVTTQGVVVGDFEGSASASGFYIQDLTGDDDTSTSDGIFVYTGSNNFVSAGQVVRVTGFARERFPDVSGFGQTALNGSNSNTVVVPAANIVNCGTGSVPVTGVTLPVTSINDFERYEGMYVRFPQSLVIAEYFNYDRFGEIVLALPLAGETRPFTGTAIDEPGTPANNRTAANALSRITLDDAQSTQNPGSPNPGALRHPNGLPFSLLNKFRGGDTVQNAIGVLGYDFNLYRIIPTGPAGYTSVNPRPASPDSVGNTNLRVAAMNTLNFFLTLDTTANDTGPGPCGGNANLDCRGADASEPAEFSRQRAKLLAALAGLDADIIGLNELENTPNVEPMADIVAGLNAQLGAGTYAYINTGTIGTDAIKVGMIYKPAKVAPVGVYQILDSTDDPRFVDTRSRPALAQTFEDLSNGARFTVVVNHLKSKSDSGLAATTPTPSVCMDADPGNNIPDCDQGDGQGYWNYTRTQAAQALVDWLATDPTGSGDPDFLIMGDLNSYAMEDPIDAVKAGSDDATGTSDDYTNLIYNYQGTYAYSYTFDGQAGYLDHALANASMTAQVTGAADWHINSDEPDILDYDTSFKPTAQENFYEPNAYRSSDHDPVIVGLSLRLNPRESLAQIIAELQAILAVNPNTPLADKIEDVLAKVQSAAAELDKTPPDEQAAIGNIEGAVGDLEAAVKDGLLSEAEGTRLMIHLTSVARQMASDAIAQALDQGGDPNAIGEAQGFLAEGDALRTSGQFKDAVNKYKDALLKAESALP